MKKFLFAAALAVAVMLNSCCNRPANVQMGSESQFDTLSYVLGANVATGFKYQFSDIDFDWGALEAQMMKTAKSANTKSKFEKYQKTSEMLREFMMTTRGERMREILKQRDAADSVRRAQGDSTKVEYPMADPALFVSADERAEISAAFGMDLGYNISHSDLPVQLYWLAKAMSDVREENVAMSEEDMNNYWMKYIREVRPAENLAASKAWLEEMAAQSGAQTTESGLVYKIEKAGDELLKASDLRDQVKVHYTGRLRNGVVFDSSIFENLPFEMQAQRKQYNPEGYDKNEPIEFALNQVIKGWGEGVQLVGKGGKITLWIPSDLAYGPRGSRSIGPNEALEFEIEVLDITPYEEPVEEATEEAATEEAVTEEAAE